MKKVAIIMGSDSDLPVVEKAADTLKEYGVPFEMHVYSAHRTPVQAKEFSENAAANGFIIRSLFETGNTQWRVQILIGTPQSFAAIRALIHP